MSPPAAENNILYIVICKIKFVNIVFFSAEINDLIWKLEVMKKLSKIKLSIRNREIKMFTLINCRKVRASLGFFLCFWFYIRDVTGRGDVNFRAKRSSPFTKPLSLIKSLFFFSENEEDCKIKELIYNFPGN